VRLSTTFAGYVLTFEMWRQNFLCEHPMGLASDVETDFAVTKRYSENEAKMDREKIG